MEKNSFFVAFTLLKHVEYGKSIYLSGSLPEIGSWNIAKAQRLK